jgi:hypothetical protein
MITRILIVLACALIGTGCRTVNKSSSDWRPLLGADATNHWRTFGGKGFPQTGWALEGEVLHLQAGGQGGELISVATFDNFELEWEWKITPRGNNGLKYLVTESRPSAPGHEYQMVDDATTTNPKYKTATFYDVLAVQVPVPPHPPGQWNHSRLVIRGNQVEHWLNATKVLSYELGSAATQAALAKSKFKDSPGFGAKIKGHLLLTNHKDATWYRNLRIRELSAPK